MSPPRGSVWLAALKTAMAILAGAMWLHAAARADAPTPWPQVELPADAQAFDVGGVFLSNGLPTRATGFISPRSSDAVVEWFKRRPAITWSVERLQDATVLGRAEGSYFITIKLVPLRNGTRGLLAIVDLDKAAQSRARLQARLSQWLSELPSGTQVLNHVASHDGGRQSEQLVLVNHQSEAVNIRRVTAALIGRGFALERTLDPENVKAPRAPTGAQVPGHGKAVLFKSGAREALALFFRGDGGQSVITINTITQEQP